MSAQIFTRLIGFEPYEFICREVGIAVHYCAEQFENDGSLSATIIKSMKRAVAGEYSRELWA